MHETHCLIDERTGFEGIVIQRSQALLNRLGVGFQVHGLLTVAARKDWQALSTVAYTGGATVLVAPKDGKIVGYGRVAAAIRVVWFAALLATLVLPARAADIKIMVPGPTFAGMNALAQSFNTENAPALKAVLIGGTVGTIQKNVATGMPADIVVLPTVDMDILEKAGGIQIGSRLELGRVPFGLAVRSGAPHPDISTPEKFRTVLLAAKSVSYNDPAIGSLGGVIVAQILARPEFAGVQSFA